MNATIGEHATPNLWIPDDFGHDTQLPALIQAMGFTGVAFWRITGDVLDAPCTACASPVEGSPFSVLMANGLDFIWTASDGSGVQAHWLSGGYCQGNNELGFTRVPSKKCLCSLVDSLPAAAPTPYYFVPIDCDFATPYTPDLLTIVAEWNHSTTSGVEIVVSSFNSFMDLVRAASGGGKLNSIALTLNPYFSGAYGSRMDLKIGHYLATRTLLRTETFAVLLDRLAASQGGAFATASQRVNHELKTAWQDLMPSTHHDYVTGTAVDSVYTGEQQKLLGQALAGAP